MPRYASKPGMEEPYTIPNKGPTPKIDMEEGLPPGGLDIAWVDDSRKNDYHWSRGLPWHVRLHAHATMNSARRNVKCKRPFEPKDDLDFVLNAAYCPTMGTFFEKTDPYLQIETVLGEDVHLKTKRPGAAEVWKPKSLRSSGKAKPWIPPMKLIEPWRVMRNRIVIYPDKSPVKGYDIVFSNGGVDRRENIYNVKLGIASYHSPQTNPGYSRTPCGAFYSI